MAVPKLFYRILKSLMTSVSHFVMYSKILNSKRISKLKNSETFPKKYNHQLKMHDTNSIKRYIEAALTRIKNLYVDRDDLSTIKYSPFQYFFIPPKILNILSNMRIRTF